MMVFRQIRKTAGSYPRQFWLLFWGSLLSTTGSSMIWPFLMIYASARLKLPLTDIASLMTINATSGLIFSFVAGAIVDRFGRKWVMVVSLVGNGLVYLFMSQANTMGYFAILMAFTGMFNPLYRVGSDAMLADLIPMENRVDAYSLLRMSNNLGISLGPAIGGILASASYNTAFLCATTGLAGYGLLLMVFARETIPTREEGSPPRASELFTGYRRVFKDRPYIAFVVTFTLIQICASLIWVLLGVYAKDNYGVAENRYGLIPTTNAIMVVLFQVYVTTITKQFPPLMVMAAGAFLYASGVGSVALGQGFWGFWISIVIITIGELVIVPTSSTYAANSAPVDMRGRYLSFYSLTWIVATGIGPVLGGFLNDRINPHAIWYGGFLIGMLSVAGFLLLSRRYPHGQALQPAESEER